MKTKNKNIMAEEKEPQVVDVDGLIRIAAANNRMTLSDIATISGKSKSTLSTLMKRGKPRLKDLIQILKATGENLDIKLKNDQVLRIEIEE